MNKPFFSIIVPTFNRASYIENAIQSVLGQTYEEWELVIIDDGSTDDTYKVCTSFNDPRIKYTYQNNSERSAARNKGIDIAKGEWVCFLDSDDLYLKTHLEILHKEIIKSNVPSLIITGNLINDEGVYSKHPLIDTEANNVLLEIWNKFILINSVCVHNSILIENRFDPRFRIWEDTHLWMRIAAKHPVKQIKSYTAIQIIHNESSVRSGFHKVKICDIYFYIQAIRDLQINHYNLFKDQLSLREFKKYIHTKYQMYLYQARQNKQILVSSIIIFKGFLNYPSVYYIKEIPKIFLNKLGIGIHEKSNT